MCVASTITILSGGEPTTNVYLDVITGNVPHEETRSAEEIKIHMKNKLNTLMGVERNDDSV